MQQILYNNCNTLSQGRAAEMAAASQPIVRGAGLLRGIGRKWDLVGGLALMASSTAYALFALSHLG